MVAKRNGFTLIELIVVVTIIAVLGTIAFISFKGFSADSRDSVRVTDTTNIVKSLELTRIQKGKYPIPTKKVDIEYKGNKIWEQGEFGENTINALKEISKTPTDPLTKNKYTYSTTENQKNFQIAGISEGDGGGIKAKVDGSYNSTTLTTKNSGSCETVTVPSLILSDVGTGSTFNLTGNVNFVLDTAENLPSTYEGTYPDSERDNGTAFTVSTVYNKCSITTKQEADDYINSVNTAYDQYDGKSESAALENIVNPTSEKSNKIEIINNFKETGGIVTEPVINEISSSSESITPDSTPEGSGDGALFSDDFTGTNGASILTSVAENGVGWRNFARPASYYISQEIDGEWEHIIRKHFPIEYDTKSFEIDSNNNEVKLKIRQKNTEFASIEMISLHSCGLDLKPDYAKYSSSGEDVLEKIVKDDYRVVDAHEKDIEVYWKLPKDCNAKPILTLRANEYSSKGVEPMSTPKNRIERKLSDKTFIIDGNIDEVDGRQEANFIDLWHPTSGHPDNLTYFYFNEDKDNIYLSVDITSDNTADLNVDWAEVTLYGDEKKEFRIDDLSPKWGKCGFGFTSKVSYEHQFCEFKIPKAEFNTNEKYLDFSFRYYGTESMTTTLVLSNGEVTSEGGDGVTIYYPHNDSDNSVLGDFTIEFDYIANQANELFIEIGDNSYITIMDMGADGFNIGGHVAGGGSVYPIVKDLSAERPFTDGQTYRIKAEIIRFGDTGEHLTLHLTAGETHLYSGSFGAANATGIPGIGIKNQFSSSRSKIDNFIIKGERK